MRLPEHHPQPRLLHRARSGFRDHLRHHPGLAAVHDALPGGRHRGRWALRSKEGQLLRRSEHEGAAHVRGGMGHHPRRGGLHDRRAGGSIAGAPEEPLLRGGRGGKLPFLGPTEQRRHLGCADTGCTAALVH